MTDDLRREAIPFVERGSVRRLGHGGIRADHKRLDNTSGGHSRNSSVKSAPVRPRHIDAIVGSSGCELVNIRILTEITPEDGTLNDQTVVSRRRIFHAPLLAARYSSSPSVRSMAGCDRPLFWPMRSSQGKRGRVEEPKLHQHRRLIPVYVLGEQLAVVERHDRN